MDAENCNSPNSQETQYNELRSINQGTIQNNEILSELRNLNNRINILEQNVEKLLQNLTKEMIALRNEVRQFKSIPEEIPTNLLPKLPTKDLQSFKLLCENLDNDDVCMQLKYVLGQVAAVDAANFIRRAIKRLMN